MPEWPREVFIDVDLWVRIRYGRSEQIPFRYAIVLETFVDGEWTAFHLWDNAHHVYEHHEHEYTRSTGKQDPTVHGFLTINQAMAEAMERATREWQSMLENWRTR